MPYTFYINPEIEKLTLRLSDACDTCDRDIINLVIDAARSWFADSALRREDLGVWIGAMRVCAYKCATAETREFVEAELDRWMSLKDFRPEAIS